MHDPSLALVPLPAITSLTRSNLRASALCGFGIASTLAISLLLAGLPIVSICVLVSARGEDEDGQELHPRSVSVVSTAAAIARTRSPAGPVRGAPHTPQ